MARVKQISNAGCFCRCGAYMYANVYDDKIQVVCPQCGEYYEIEHGEEQSNGATDKSRS